MKDAEVRNAARTCSEICIDADIHCNDLNYLSNLWNEVLANKHSYSLVEIDFIHEHISKHSTKEIMDVKKEYTLKEILEHARRFAESIIPVAEKICDVCKARNCIYNETCINCGLQL